MVLKLRSIILRIISFVFFQASTTTGSWPWYYYAAAIGGPVAGAGLLAGLGTGIYFAARHLIRKRSSKKVQSSV